MPVAQVGANDPLEVGISLGAICKLRARYSSPRPTSSWLQRRCPVSRSNVADSR